MILALKNGLVVVLLYGFTEGKLKRLSGKCNQAKQGIRMCFFVNNKVKKNALTTMGPVR